MDYHELCQRYYAGELSEEDMQAWRLERLDVVLRHVREKSDFYRRHLPDDVPFTGLP